MPTDLRFDANEAALIVDLYELTMAASYFAIGYNDAACFSLTIRRMPPRRGFLVAAGLERLLEALEDYRFEPPALDYLDSLKIFAPEFLGFLGSMRFTGEVFAMPEGSIFFAEEPILEIHAPLIEAQLLETLVINQIGMASLIASKAARSVLAARGRRLIDFGLRRSQGVDAGLIAARSSYLAGFAGTSNVLAGRRYGIPVYGTMAHSYIMAHDREREAFEHFVALFPRLSTLLVDTYDTIRGVENAVAVGRQLKEHGFKLQAVRLDSGDLVELSVKTRRILDQNGLNDVSIFASGNLDEYRIQELLRAGGARIVESPSNTGFLGVTPVGVIAGQTTEASANKQLRALSARLRADPRVLWVQPLADEGIPADLRAPDAADQRAPDAREH